MGITSALHFLLLAAFASGTGQDGLAGHWVGHLEHEQQLYPLLLDVRETGSSLTATLDLPEYCIYGSRAEVTWGSSEVEIVTDDVELFARLSGGELDGVSRGFQGVEAGLHLVRESLEPVVYRYEAFEFQSGDARLAGTLVLPEGEGPFPTIVWAHGSGPDTRETFYYSGRAHLFAQNGIASLIYDKRGAGASTGAEAWLLENLVADALAGIRAVAAHPAVDSIGIAGFSQGGWVAPIAASREDAVDFVVVGATPGISVGEQNVFSCTSRLKRDGFSEEDILAAEAFLTQLYLFYQTGVGRDDVLHALREAEQSGWFHSRWVSNVTFISEESGLRAGKHPSWDPSEPDASGYWAQIKVPVFSMWGANDIDVPPEQSKWVIDRALRAAGNENYELHILPDASHGFWLSSAGERWDWLRQAPGCHQRMVDWVLDCTRSN